MSKDSFAQSASYLKQAVPLMIKYQIPTTPPHYAVWYHYVAATLPPLNQAIEETLRQQGTCSQVTSERLYHQFLASQQEKDLESAKQNLASVANEFAHSVQDALADTGLFQDMLDRNFSKLGQIEEEGLSLEETMGVLRELVRESRDIRMATLHFRSQISNAEKEIRDLRQALDETRRQANEDPLTGLLNRRAFELELDALSRTGKPFCLILADIDRFKAFNDEYGHLLGDQVLRAFARRLRDAAKEGVQVFRFGGEEFAILVPGKNLQLSRQLAESLRRATEKLSVLDRKSGRRVDSITASFGVAEHNGREHGDDLVERTDQQLYKAKELGRNRVMPMAI
ncbi:GGDEF domain-containing protein [Aeromonas simiae]|uniref:diguanylate cyclase n=1 Tax=Aeromonas simiae TaxID=218936 RepID=A0A5J6WUT0_9GAMM|nr:GGDEF domain-containing protein [Aeromonas simiae]QFI53628.1 GGDEF domain-containing protein [Aeromonas simiae]